MPSSKPVVIPVNAGAPLLPDQSAAKDTRAPAPRLRRVLLAILLIDALAVVITVRRFVLDRSIKDLESSTLDVLIVDLVRWLAIAVCLLGAARATGGWARAVAAGWWTSFASLLLCTCKAVVWSYKGAAPWRTALVVGSAVFAALETALATRLHSVARHNKAAACPEKCADSCPDAPPTLRALLSILRPYFLPRGAVNKLRTAATFVFIGLSKGANLLAPIALGQAVKQLSDDAVVPWRHLLECDTQPATWHPAYTAATWQSTARHVSGTRRSSLARSSSKTSSLSSTYPCSRSPRYARDTGERYERHASTEILCRLPSPRSRR